MHVFKGVAEEGLGSESDPHVSVMTSYDHPWTTEGRRDEVMIRRIRGEGEVWIGPWGLL